MGKSYSEVFDINERLTERYLLGKENKDRYVCSVGISLVRLNDPHADASVLEDYCISILVKGSIKSPFDIPLEEEGVRIYKREDGLLNALKKKDRSFSAP